jgi:hypothetical protein
MSLLRQDKAQVLTINYWDIENDDASMKRFAKGATENILRIFENTVDEIHKGCLSGSARKGNEESK